MRSARMRRTMGGLLAAATLATAVAVGAAAGSAGADPAPQLGAVGAAPTVTSGGSVSKAEAADPAAVDGVVTNAVGDVTIDNQGCAPDPISTGEDTTCTYAVQNQTTTADTVDLSATGDSEVAVTGATQGATVSNGTATANDVALPPRTGSAMSVVPGSTFAGYYPLSTIPIGPQTISDDQILNYTVQPFTWNGTVYTSIGISSNGYAVVGGADTTKDQSSSPQDLPNGGRPNNVLAPFWTDLTPAGGGALRVATVANSAEAPCVRSYWFVAEWEMYEYGTTTMRKAQLWIEAKDPECATAVTPAERVYFTYDHTSMTAAPARPFRIGAENAAGTGGAMRPAGELPTQDYVVSSTGSVTPAPVVTWKVTGRGTSPGTGTIAATVESALIPGSSTVFSDVTVNGHPAPVVADDPDDLTVTTGQQAVFHAEADAGSTVRWEVSTDDGGSWDPVPGATATTLAFTSTMAHDGNRYRAVFTNASGTASTTSAEATLTVQQIATTTALTANPASPGYGDPVSFTATVAPSGATGSVQFAIDGNPLGSPVALSGGSATSSSISYLAPGSHEVTASYLGDTDHAASDATSSVSVGLIPTSTTLTNDPLGPTVGETVTLTATVTPASATGTVQFVLDGELLGAPVALVNGVATSPASPPLGLGLHVPLAFYQGDATHATSNAGSDLSFEVTSKSTAFTVVASNPAQQVRRGTAAYTATLSPAPNGGTVQFAVDGVDVGDPVAVVNGTATTPSVPVTAAAGSHSVTATYSGDTTYGSTTGSGSFEVVKIATDFEMSPNWSEAQQPQLASFVAQVRPGKPTGDLTIEVENSGEPNQVVGLDDGGARFGIQFPRVAFSYRVVLSYGGDADYLPVSIEQAFFAEDEATTFVRETYDIVLDRAPDAAGLTYWAGRINSGTPPTTVVDALARSAEGRRRLVQSAYQDFLGRAADPAGLAYWTGKLAAGTTPEFMRTSLLASDEGYRRTGGNPLGYSVTLYDALLHRNASASELTYWTTWLGRFPSRWHRQQAALIVARSNEGTRSAVRTALSTACGGTTATDEQKSDLSQVWRDTGGHPHRLAGWALAQVCYPDFSTN